MKFSEAMKCMLAGKRVTVPGWGNQYIRLADDLDKGVGIVDKTGETYEILKYDYYYDWKVYDEGDYCEGDKLSYATNGDTPVYLIFKEHSNLYGILDTEYSKALSTGLTQDSLKRLVKRMGLFKI